MGLSGKHRLDCGTSNELKVESVAGRQCVPRESLGESLASMLSMGRVSREVRFGERRSRSRAFEVNGHPRLVACRLKCAAKFGDDQQRVRAGQQADGYLRQQQGPYQLGDCRRPSDRRRRAKSCFALQCDGDFFHEAGGAD